MDLLEPDLRETPVAYRRLGLDGRFLRSRVARRIFLSVVLCALVPITSFAWLSFRHVTRQLERDATARLTEDAKSRGMAAVERLILADTALRVTAEALTSYDSAPPLDALPPALRDLAEGRFLELVLAHHGFANARGAPALPALTPPTPGDEAALAAGRPWLRVVGVGTGPRRIVLGRFASGPHGPRLVAAVLDPRFLFAVDGLRGNERLRVVDAVGQPIFAAPTGDPATARSGDEALLAGNWSAFLHAAFRAEAWTFVIEEARATVLAPMQQFELVFPLVALLSFLAMSLAALVLVRRSLLPIEILHGATRRLAARDLRARVSIESGDEFADLGRSFNQMAESIARQVDVMTTLNEVGTALSVERDRTRLLEVIVHGAMAVTGARAGALSLLDASDRPERMLLRLRDGAERTALASRLETAAARAVASGRAIDDETDGLFSIPMQNHEGEVIGVLQLVPDAGAGAFDLEARDLAASLASQTAVALTRDRLAGEFRGLFEGLIQLLVKAIDEKSPYTGAHCRRVPILTELIADAACATKEGPLRDFALSEPERYELRIAALLHDCGKVTTPVHVQDKATKLETLFDRIELVETRFAAVRRELELGSAEAAGGVGHDAGPGGPGARLAATLRRLDDDRAFLRRANTGGESMDEADQERVRAVACAWRWRDAAGVERPILTEDEVENLCISRGTLNEREREIINQHVVTTIRMLEELPYPRSLRNVPFIAGCHHERMDGCGYPNHLTRDQMSIQARILGLADVFEALTAKDRPYKSGMKVSAVLDILGSMRDEGHIDPDLFEMFVREKVYLRYAVEHLDVEQLDEEMLDEAAAVMLRRGGGRFAPG